jgi:hypothetical protein
LELIVTWHVVLVPAHPPPDQPANVESAAGVSVNVTTDPVTNACRHVAPQLIPDGLLVTEPEPDPALEPTVSVCVAGVSKVGVTV